MKKSVEQDSTFVIIWLQFVEKVKDTYLCLKIQESRASFLILDDTPKKNSHRLIEDRTHLTFCTKPDLLFNYFPTKCIAFTSFLLKRETTLGRKDRKEIPF